MAKICFFAGGRPGHHPSVEQAAAQLATWCAENGHGVILGGMAGGLMKTLGATALAHGGTVTIIYPTTLTQYESDKHPNLTHTTVHTLHQRLEMMTAQADIFIAFPGGLGTLHEIAQVWADNKVGLLNKPILILNQEGFYNHLIAFLNHSIESGYVAPQQARQIKFCPNTQAIANELSNLL